MPGEPGRAPPPTAVEVWPSVAPFGEAGRISVSIIVLAFLCSSAGPPAPPRDRSQFTAGGRIQPRAAIRPRAAAATDQMWTPLLAATKCAHQPLHPLPQSLLTCYC